MLRGMSDVEALGPWLPPAEPDLTRLAFAAADAEGTASLQAWPEVRSGGIAFGGLPPFLVWRGRWKDRWHLVLVQPREVGALVPGARPADLPQGWLGTLDLEALARPLRHHPDQPGASVHLVSLRRGVPPEVRTSGEPAPQVVAAVLARLAG